jgi:hypothetical protein
MSPFIVTLNVIMLNVIMLNVIMLNVTLPLVFTLNVTALCIEAEGRRKHKAF